MPDQRNQSELNAPSFLGSNLLIATPNMADPRFARSVILLGAHDKDHAMGIIINKTLPDVKFSEILDYIDVKKETSTDQYDVFYGGPIQTERGFVVHSLDYRTKSTLVITPEIGFTGSKEILQSIMAEDATEAPKHWFLALGYASWDSAQLESEIAENTWAHCSADEKIVFADVTTDKWSLAFAKLGVTSAMLTPDWFAGRNSTQDQPN